MRSVRDLLITLSIVISALYISSCGNKSMDGMVIIARSAESSSPTSDNLWRYKPLSQLVAINPANPDEPGEILTKEFYSAGSPEVSYDGKHLLFSAQRNQNDPWQIWEMDLGNLEATPVTSSIENCYDPAYLPLGQAVFSRSSENDSLKAGHTLFTCNLDGTNLRRITFNPHEYFASSVLMDGRIISISRQLYPSAGKSLIMVMRPDGTKSELFYDNSQGNEVQTRGWEASDGKIYFVEAARSGNNKMDIVSVRYNRPLHSSINLTSAIEGNFYSAYPLQDGKLMVTYKAAENARISLYEYDPENRSIGQPLYKSSEYDVMEAVAVREHQRPKKLPSEVDTGVRTGQLLCQDINVTGLSPSGSKMTFPRADRIEIIGIDSSLGIVKVEEDGSFYLKVAADMPFTIKTMDADGKVINGPGSWIWLRPNERRGCVGCHEDHEMVPANKLPLAVKNNPVTVPIHVSIIKEKEVELE